MAAYYNEFDSKTAAWLRELIKAGLITPGDVDDRPIQEVKSNDLLGYTQCHFFAGIGGWSYALRLARWPDNRPVWTGSCPCQPFADCGKGRGFDDPRHLWPMWRKLTQERNPATIFGEQVASAAALIWLDLVFNNLEDQDYACAAADLCAAGVGAPQRRQRLLWVANANDARWEGAERHGEPDQARKEWSAPRGESMRSIGGYWPPGPREVGRIPVLANGLPGIMGRCRGYGNAIVPQVAAEFITAYLETREDLHDGRFLTFDDF